MAYGFGGAENFCGVYVFEHGAGPVEGYPLPPAAAAPRAAAGAGERGSGGPWPLGSQAYSSSSDVTSPSKSSFGPSIDASAKTMVGSIPYSSANLSR